MEREGLLESGSMAGAKMSPLGRERADDSTAPDEPRPPKRRHTACPLQPVRSSKEPFQAPWWLAAELACRSCSAVHALTLEVHCARCGGRVCTQCVVVAGTDWLCAVCARADPDDEG